MISSNCFARNAVSDLGFTLTKNLQPNIFLIKKITENDSFLNI